jgi:hypothetical protein
MRAFYLGDVHEAGRAADQSTAWEVQFRNGLKPSFCENTTSISKTFSRWGGKEGAEVRVML